MEGLNQYFGFQFVKFMKILTILILCFSALVCLGQSAETLNEQSKEFLRKKEYKNAIPLLKQAAEMGNAEAQYNYGIFFEQGIEVQKDEKTANEWFLKAAEQGWKDAQFKLAYNYAAGRGVSQDYKQALFWLLKCAEQKDTECMFNVIGLYKLGLGTEKNPDKVLEWAMNLALLPDTENLRDSGRITSARANLAVMYRDGEDVTQDTVKSYAWFLIYNETKKSFSIIQQQRFIDAIKELEKNLTPSDKDAAKIEAEKLLGSKLKNLNNLYKQEF